MLLEISCTALVAAVAQWLAFERMQPRHPVGDELAYITGRDIFIRPPVMGWLGSALRHADARTRYRITVLPGLCLLAALALGGPEAGAPTAVTLLAIALPLWALLLLTAARAGRELPST